ncbi:MAG: toxin ParE1/3/4 [Variibacter sp.]|jgi:toxin ParE1/3/4|nr:toxin ParE1/3/4 [Variibacter sp.]
MIQVTVSARAKRDLTDIVLFLRKHNAEAARAFARRFDRRIKDLSQLPWIGRPRPDIRPDFRSLVLAPYLIFYIVESGGVVVVRVLHSSRDIVQAIQR